MDCYRDMIFCSAECLRHSCHKHKSGIPNDTKRLPVASANFSEVCWQYNNPELRETTVYRINNDEEA